jgi:P-type Ca2+ transporter type 2C
VNLENTRMKPWHTQTEKEILTSLVTDLEQGLDEDEAQQRLQTHGPNELVDKGLKNPLLILWDQIKGVMVVMLIIAAVISLLLDETTDAIVIGIIVFLNATLGFVQEYRAEQAMAALKKMAVPHVRVRRGGHVQDTLARDLVPGDIILLEAGSAIPADCRLLEAVNFRLQEAILTGESEPVEKASEALPQENLSIADRRNLAYMGTTATYGRAVAVVIETGMRTQLGHIATMIQSVSSEPTPLQRRLDQLGKGLAVAALAIVTLVFVLGILRGEEMRLMIMTAIGMAVAAVPEGLPAVVTIALAFGAQRMLHRRALIRKLPAVETLGSVTTICSDKTGTLTENRMTVTVLDVAGNRLDLKERVRNFSPTVSPGDAVAPELLEHSAVSLLLLGSTLCNDAILEPDEENPECYTAVGDPTEGALVIAAAQAGLWKAKLEKELVRVGELPFDSDRKRMTTVHQLPKDDLPQPLKFIQEQAHKPYIAFSKGAIDSLLDIADRVWVSDHIENMSQAWRERIQQGNDDMAKNGMRVLGVGYELRNVPDNSDPADPLESKLVFVGLMGMIDPARPEVADAVHTTQTAGIRPIMITGDHPLTALHIARELGIVKRDSNPNARMVITGQELAEMSVEQIKEWTDEISVFARVSPEHKLKIVQALQEKGQIVAMTGDGVNDAPALKKADIGVAMGISGTDVSKEAADMVLLDDNYATIVAAVEEGRRIYDNIRKFIKYTMTSNAGEIWVMLVAPFFGMPLPLLPLQILWVNLVTDGLPGLALTAEPPEPNTMKRPPYSPQESIFGRGMGRDVLWIGLLMGAVSLGVGFWAWSTGIAAWQTMVFTTLTLSQMGNAMATRSERESLFRLGILSNKMLLGSVLLTLVLQLGVIYVPFLQEVFSTTALSAQELAISLLVSLLVFVSVEMQKWMLRRRSPQDEGG